MGINDPHKIALAKIHRRNERLAITRTRNAKKKLDADKLKKYAVGLNTHASRKAFLKTVRLFPTSNNVELLRHLLTRDGLKAHHRAEAAMLLLRWGNGQFKPANRRGVKRVALALSAYKETGDDG